MTLPADHIGPCIVDPAFHVCVRESLALPELVENFDRLYGHNLSRRGAPIEVAIDDTTGRTEAGVREFMVFVRDCVYSRLPPGTLEEIRAKFAEATAVKPRREVVR